MTDLCKSRRATLPLVLALTVGAGMPRLAAQMTAQAVPTIEPRLTRIFGSDSMEMWGAAVSPDGRWVAFVNSEGGEVNNLWVVTTSGGAPVRLTSGRYLDMFPTWFPSGDRIAFQSDRASSSDDPQSFVMTIPFDPRTGQASGPPRQVTLEPAHGFALSPDGRSIVYFSDVGQHLKVIPAEGGTARQLFEIDDSIASVKVSLPNMVWSDDGAFIYFVLRRTGTGARSVMRVSAAGGNVREVATLPAQGYSPTLFSPDARYLYRRIAQGPGQGFLHEVTTIDGRVVARLALPRGIMPSRFTPDGRGLVANRTNMVAPIRVVPVAGGPVRQLTEAHDYDWPLGWSPDGSRVFLMTSNDGGHVVLEAPVDGGPARQWPIPTEATGSSGISPDGRYFFYTIASQQGERATLSVRRLSDGQTRVITQTAYNVLESVVTGPGGSPTDGNQGFYFERRGAQLELWAWTPEGPSRLLRSFPLSYAGRTGFGVHGNRIAYTERRGDSSAVFVAEGRNGTPRHLFTSAGSVSRPVWSHDGRWLAFEYEPPGNPSPYQVLVAGIGQNGTVAAPPRILNAGVQWGWQIRWLPDDHALTVIGGTGMGLATQIFLVSLHEGEQPVALTRDDPATRWGYELSPDGRYVAYPAEISRGSSLWLVDLGEVLSQAEGRRGTRR